MVALAQNWTSVGPQHQCVLTMLTEPRLERWREALCVYVCVFVRTAVSFSLIMSTCYSVIQLSLIDVAVFCSEPRRSRGFAAQLYCLCPFVQPHNINRSPLPPLVKPAETSGTSWCSARALMPAGDDRSMSALWNTFRLASLSPTTREENWPFISSAHWAHAPPCCSPGTQKNTPLQTPTDEL